MAVQLIENDAEIIYEGKKLRFDTVEGVQRAEEFIRMKEVIDKETGLKVPRTKVSFCYNSLSPKAPSEPFVTGCIEGKIRKKKGENIMTHVLMRIPQKVCVPIAVRTQATRTVKDSEPVTAKIALEMAKKWAKASYPGVDYMCGIHIDQPDMLVHFLFYTKYQCQNSEENAKKIFHAYKLDEYMKNPSVAEKKENEQKKEEKPVEHAMFGRQEFSTKAMFDSGKKEIETPVEEPKEKQVPKSKNFWAQLQELDLDQDLEPVQSADFSNEDLEYVQEGLQREDALNALIEEETFQDQRMQNGQGMENGMFSVPQQKMDDSAEEPPLTERERRMQTGTFHYIKQPNIYASKPSQNQDKLDIASIVAKVRASSHFGNPYQEESVYPQSQSSLTMPTYMQEQSPMPASYMESVERAYGATKKAFLESDRKAAENVTENTTEHTNNNEIQHTKTESWENPKEETTDNIFANAEDVNPIPEETYQEAAPENPILEGSYQEEVSENPILEGSYQEEVSENPILEGSYQEDEMPENTIDENRSVYAESFEESQNAARAMVNAAKEKTEKVTENWSSGEFQTEMEPADSDDPLEEIKRNAAKALFGISSVLDPVRNASSAEKPKEETQTETQSAQVIFHTMPEEGKKEPTNTGRFDFSEQNTEESRIYAQNSEAFSLDESALKEELEQMHGTESFPKEEPNEKKGKDEPVKNFSETLLKGEGDFLAKLGKSEDEMLYDESEYAKAPRKEVLWGNNNVDLKEVDFPEEKKVKAVFTSSSLAVLAEDKNPFAEEIEDQPADVRIYVKGEDGVNKEPEEFQHDPSMLELQQQDAAETYVKDRKKSKWVKIGIFCGSLIFVAVMVLIFKIVFF